MRFKVLLNFIERHIGLCIQHVDVTTFSYFAQATLVEFVSGSFQRCLVSKEEYWVVLLSIGGVVFDGTDYARVIVVADVFVLLLLAEQVVAESTVQVEHTSALVQDLVSCLALSFEWVRCCVLRTFLALAVSSWFELFSGATLAP